MGLRYSNHVEPPEVPTPAGPGSSNLLALIALQNPAFSNAVVVASIRAEAILQGTPLQTLALRSGKCTWARFVDRDGIGIVDGRVGTVSNQFDFIVDPSDVFVQGNIVRLVSYTAIRSMVTVLPP